MIGFCHFELAKIRKKNELARFLSKKNIKMKKIFPILAKKTYFCNPIIRYSL